MSEELKLYYDRQLLKRGLVYLAFNPSLYRKPTWRERLWHIIRYRRVLRRIYIGSPMVEWKTIAWRKYEP